MKRTYEISAPRLVIPLYQNPLSCQQPVNRIQTIDRKTGSQPTAGQPRADNPSTTPQNFAGYAGQASSRRKN